MLNRTPPSESCFFLDLRSLAVFRIGLGLVLLWDLLDRARYLQDHYTDLGVLPGKALGQIDPAHLMWSFHHLASTPNQVLALFMIHGLFALALLFGFRARFAAFGCWLFLCSLQGRNPLLLIGADHLLRILLFWAMVLPCSANFSLDASRGKGSRAAPPAFLPALGFVIQVALFYLVAGWAKNGSAWRDGSALWYVVNLDSMVEAPAFWLRQHPALCTALTHITLWWERLAPLCFFLPKRFFKTRLVVLAGFVLMQGGFWATMVLGHFPVVSTIAILPLLPPRFWNKLLGESPRAQNIAPEKGAWPLFRLVMAGYMLFFIFGWTLINMLIVPHQKFPMAFFHLSSVVRANQNWGVFAPQPQMDDGWWIQLAHTGPLGRINALDGSSPSYQQPENLSASVGGLRWHQYYQKLWADKGDQLKRHSDWLCQRMERLNLKRQPVHQISLVFMHRHVGPPGQPTTLKQLDLYSCPCSPQQKTKKTPRQ